MRLFCYHDADTLTLEAANDDREEDNECSLHVDAELIDGVTCLHDRSAEAELMEM